MSRIVVLTGNYGSGKTEIALNMALAQVPAAVTLVDLDIVNPYFRSGGKRELLEGRGVELIAPDFEAMNMEAVSLPPQVQSVFDRPDRTAIFDVGGDPVGARALGRYFPLFQREGYEMLYVVNTKRPRASAADNIIEMLRDVEASSRLKVSALIHNTNLASQTVAADIFAGQEIMQEVCERTGLVVRYTCVDRGILPTVQAGRLMGELMPLDLKMRPVWMQDER
ncbi:MAG: ATP-binding protein [Christensenellales bacterium]|jgi:hypothetical protein